jgi:hypothetical protein
MGVDFQVGVAGFSVGLSEKVLGSLKERFSRRTLYGGPCMLIERHNGLALDSTTSPHHRCRPVLWTPHGLQWQQWRFRRSRRRTSAREQKRNKLWPTGPHWTNQTHHYRAQNATARAQ